MPSKITLYKVFIASPSGLQDERRAFAKEIEEYNKIEAIHRGVKFQAVGWEDTLPGMGRPQSIINTELKQCDYLVLILHDRWGSTPGYNKKNATSGTEEEYKTALDCYYDDNFPMKQIICLFKSVPPNQLADPGPQLQQVIDFKKGIEADKILLFSNFTSIDEFKTLIRKNLAKWMRDEQLHIGGYMNPLMLQEVSFNINPNLISNTVNTNDELTQEMIKNAWELTNEGKLVDAEITFSKALINNPSEWILLEYSSFLKELGQIDKSIVMIDRALELAKSGNNSNMEALAYSYKGIYLNLKGNLDGSMEMYKKSLAIYEKLQQIEGMANQYGNIGIILRARGDWNGAEVMYKKSLTINKKLNRSEFIATDCANLGIILEMRGDLVGAEDMYKQSLLIYENLGLFAKMANVYGNLGIVFQKRQDLDGAEEMYQKSMKINEKYGQLMNLASNYSNLGIIRSMRGDLDGAEELHKKSLEINEKLGLQERLASNYGNLGTIFSNRGNLDQAEDMFRRSLLIHDKIGLDHNRALNYLALGSILNRKDNMDGALEYINKSLEISEKIGDDELTKLIKRYLVKKK